MYFQDNYEEVAFAELVMDIVDQFAAKVKGIVSSHTLLGSLFANNFEIIRKFLEDYPEEPLSTKFQDIFPKGWTTATINNVCASCYHKMSSVSRAAMIKLQSNSTHFTTGLCKSCLTREEKTCIVNIAKLINPGLSVANFIK